MEINNAEAAQNLRHETVKQNIIFILRGERTVISSWNICCRYLQQYICVIFHKSLWFSRFFKKNSRYILNTLQEYFEYFYEEHFVILYSLKLSYYYSKNQLFKTMMKMNPKRSAFKDTWQKKNSRPYFIHSCLLPPSRDSLLAAMEAHYITAGDPFPSEIPCTPFRSIWAPQFVSFKMCNLDTSLAVYNDPWPISVHAHDAILFQPSDRRHTSSTWCLAWRQLQFTQKVF